MSIYNQGQVLQAEQKQESSPNKAFWNNHDYHRMTVTLVKGFVGWKNLIELINLAKSERDRAFLITLFSTGGRVTEVLRLRASNFTVNTKENKIDVNDMSLEKRYRREYTDATKKTWTVIKKKGIKRNPFPIGLNEPFAQELLSWINSHKLSATNKDDLLFPSDRAVDENKNPKPLNRRWAYKLMKKRLDKLMSYDLRERLGLNRPLIDEETDLKVKDQLNLWTHWWRSQRACCLASEFGFEVIELVDYFNWVNIATAVHYARLGSKKLAKKMSNVKLVIE